MCRMVTGKLNGTEQTVLVFAVDAVDLRSLGVKVSPTLSSLKYLKNYLMDCHEF